MKGEGKSDGNLLTLITTETFPPQKPDGPKPLKFEPGLSASYPRKKESDPEALPDWLRLAHVTFVEREEYRRWCNQWDKRLPCWWFPEIRQIDPPPAELENAVSDESAASNTAVRDMESVDIQQKRERNTSVKKALRRALREIGESGGRHTTHAVLVHINHNPKRFTEIKRIDFKAQKVTYITGEKLAEKPIGFQQIGRYIKAILQE